MPRDAGGTYSTPAGQPVTGGTVINSTTFNALVNDLKAEMTDSLSRSGKGGMLVPLPFADGTVSAPGISFDDETGSGLFRFGAGDVRMSILGTYRQRWHSAGVGVNGTFDATGNSTIGGTLAVTGATTLTGGVTGAVAATGAVSGTGTGAGAGVSGTGGSTSGAGVSGTGGATNGHGGSFVGDGTGTGVIATGGDSDGPGVDATGGATNGIGVRGQGTGTGQGVIGAGGGSSGVGVYAQGGTTNGIGLDAYGAGTGVAARATGPGGSTTPTAAPLRISASTNDPSTLAEGDIWIAGTSPNRYLKAYLAGGVRNVAGPF